MRKHKQRDYTHDQVPFVTSNGLETTVDAGLYDILVMLRELGVETQYSCQGDRFSSYICADYASFRPVIRETLRLWRNNKLSFMSSFVLSEFRINGQQLIRVRYNPNYRDKDAPNQYYSYERTIQSLYGDRLTVRWPKDRNPQMQQLLLEVFNQLMTREVAS